MGRKLRVGMFGSTGMGNLERQIQDFLDKGEGRVITDKLQSESCGPDGEHHITITFFYYIKPPWKSEA